MSAPSDTAPIDRLHQLFEDPVRVDGKLVTLDAATLSSAQHQTAQAFSEKWARAEEFPADPPFVAFQKRWYLELYGFASEQALGDYLQTRRVIVDAGCGLGYKAAWFAALAPRSLVLGFDLSESVLQAAARYADLPNLYFVRGDIARTGLRPGSVDYVSCDQVIHHTDVPAETFRHLARRLTPGVGEFACYVYARKALPRELLDDHFRRLAPDLASEQLWRLSEQLTELGRVLTELRVEVEVPELELLGIRGGRYDLQRFIYWNFLKCFWNEELGRDASVSCNFDWYAPSRADRYSEQEFRSMISDSDPVIRHFHKEPACFSGRFASP
jgi:SAM-dependent methyltransferase